MYIKLYDGKYFFHKPSPFCRCIFCPQRLGHFFSLYISFQIASTGPGHLLLTVTGNYNTPHLEKCINFSLYVPLQIASTLPCHLLLTILPTPLPTPTQHAPYRCTNQSNPHNTEHTFLLSYYTIHLSSGLILVLNSYIKTF